MPPAAAAAAAAAATAAAAAATGTDEEEAVPSDVAAEFQDSPVGDGDGAARVRDDDDTEVRLRGSSAALRGLMLAPHPALPEAIGGSWPEVVYVPLFGFVPYRLSTSTWFMPIEQARQKGLPASFNVPHAQATYVGPVHLLHAANELVHYLVCWSLQPSSYAHTHTHTAE